MVNTAEFRDIADVTAAARELRAWMPEFAG